MLSIVRMVYFIHKNELNSKLRNSTYTLFRQDMTLFLQQAISNRFPLRFSRTTATLVSLTWFVGVKIDIFAVSSLTFKSTQHKNRQNLDGAISVRCEFLCFYYKNQPLTPYTTVRIILKKSSIYLHSTVNHDYH